MVNSLGFEEQPGYPWSSWAEHPPWHSQAHGLRCGARGDIIGLRAASWEQINADLNSLRRELEGTCSGVCNVFVFSISFPPPHMHVGFNNTNVDLWLRLSEELLITTEVSSLMQLRAITRPRAIETEHKPHLYAHLNDSTNAGRHRQIQLRLCLLNMLWFSAPLFWGQPSCAIFL